MTRDAEVQELDQVVARQHHVRRLQIPVDDAGAVRGDQSARDLEPDVQEFFDRQWPAQESMLERLSLDEFHDEEVLSLPFADIMNVADVGMVQRRNGTRFAFEPRAGLGVALELCSQRLQRDRASQPDVTRSVYLAHPAGADELEHLV
jgi:hypothetical protein